MAGGATGVTEVDVEAGVGADGQDVASHVPAATKASVPAVPPISPEQELLGLLSIVLLPDGWFTVLDATTQTKHWVRVKAYYRSEEHTSELQSLMRTTYDVFCLKKKKTRHKTEDKNHDRLKSNIFKIAQNTYSN